MKNFVISLLIICSKLNVGQIQASDKYYPNILTNNNPARFWVKAFPLGNGRLGAMVYGNPALEQIQMNENTIWTGGPYRNNNPKIAGSLNYLRELIFDDKFVEAEDLACKTMISEGSMGMPYQTAGNLYSAFAGHENFSDYHRELSLDNAIATTTYRVKSVKYKREVFTSFMDDVIVIKLTASKPNALHFTTRITRPGTTVTTIDKNNILRMSGFTSYFEGIKGLVKFESLVKVMPEGGTLIAKDSTLEVDGANSAMKFLSIATNFKKYNNLSGNAFEIASDYLKASAKKSYIILRKDHVAFYKKYFYRVKLNLGVTDSVKKPTYIRIKEFAKGNDPQLLSLYFQFGRYLLISSSRPGGQPANLQGLWNDQLFPAWDSKYTININTEMNYWPAESTNLPEMHEPLITMVRELSKTGKETANTMYHARGWVAHHNTDIWRFNGAIDGPSGIWVCGGAWLSQHLWEKFIYNCDTDYLSSVFPTLKEASRFFLDFLVEEPTHNWLVVSPSMSPENAPYKIRKQWKVIAAGTTLDNQLVFDLFSKTILSANILHSDKSLVDSLESALAKLPPMHIGKYGQLQEWLKDWDNPVDHHRHVSHLYGLFPSNQISPYRTPELFEAARTSLIQRGDPSTGWSMNWKINLWARLQDGNHALRLFTNQITLVENCDYSNLDYEGGGGTYPNMFDACPPFQIDGNFGFTSGIVQMLLQSQDGAIHILPALPEVWNTGEVKGLKAIGGFEIVDLSWKKNNIQQLVVKSTKGGKCRIRSYWPLKSNKKIDLVENDSKNSNSFYDTPHIKKPVISDSAKLTGTNVRKVFNYDFYTKSGEIVKMSIDLHNLKSL